MTPNFASVTEAASTEAAEVDGAIGAFFSHAAAAAKTTRTHNGRTNLSGIGFLHFRSGVGLAILCRSILLAKIVLVGAACRCVHAIVRKRCAERVRFP